MESGGELCEPHFAKLLNQVKNLESVIAIYPERNALLQEYSSGMGEDWHDYLSDEMEAMEWNHGKDDFRLLPDGANGYDEDETNDFEDSDDHGREDGPDSNDELDGKDDPNRKDRPSSSKLSPSSTESDLSESYLFYSDLSLLYSSVSCL